MNNEARKYLKGYILYLYGEVPKDVAEELIQIEYSKLNKNSKLCILYPQNRGHAYTIGECDDFYLDSDEKVEFPYGDYTKNKKKCNYCRSGDFKNGHDPCIKNLPFVTNACCGHGFYFHAYLQFFGKTYFKHSESFGIALRGWPAIIVQKILKMFAKP